MKGRIAATAATALSSLLLAFPSVALPSVQGEGSAKDLRKETQHEIEARLRPRSEDPWWRAIRTDPNAPFYVEQQGLVAVPGSTTNDKGAMAGARMAHNATNVVEEGRLTKVPKHSGFQFPVGEPVEITGIQVAETLDRVTIRVETTQSHSFRKWGGQSVATPVVGELEFRSLRDRVERRDFDSIVNEIVKWVGVKDPTSPPAPAGTTVVAAPSDPIATPPAQSQQPLQLVEGQTPEEVEKILGKPEERVNTNSPATDGAKSGAVAEGQTAPQADLVYTYPTVKVFFKNGKLVDVQQRQK